MSDIATLIGPMASVIYENDEKEWLDGFDSKGLFINELPLSFVLDGQSSRDFLKQWSFSSSDSIISDRIIHKIKWLKPDGSFEVNCLLTEFNNHPAVEWKLRFKKYRINKQPCYRDMYYLWILLLMKYLNFIQTNPQPRRLFTAIRGVITRVTILCLSPKRWI